MLYQQISASSVEDLGVIMIKLIQLHLNCIINIIFYKSIILTNILNEFDTEIEYTNEKRTK